MFGLQKPLDVDSESSNSSASEPDSEEEAKEQENNQYTDFNQLNYHDYEYCANKNSNFVSNEEDAQNLQFRKAEFIISEILADMGIAKAGAVGWAGNLTLAAVMLWMRMFLHYMG